jgi:REP-associated tyrosine transposase
MARPLRIQYPGAYYHVTCRGNERRKIFRGEQDRKSFLERLALSLAIYEVSLLCYVLMDNHFHLLVMTPKGNLGEFMRHFNISYTSAFNRRHRRVGHLYQGRYKAFLIDADNYLLALSRYIHLNPVRLKAFAKKMADEKWTELRRFRWSSLAGYVFSTKREAFVDYEMVLSQTGGDTRNGRRGYRNFILAGLAGELENPLELGRGHGIVGGKDFIDWVKGKLLDAKNPRREQPALRELGREWDPEELVQKFSTLTGIGREDLCRKGKQSVERAMLMELIYRFCQVSQAKIGELLGGLDYAAVSQARGRLHMRLAQDEQVRERFQQIHGSLLQLSRPKI